MPDTSFRRWSEEAASPLHSLRSDDNSGWAEAFSVNLADGQNSSDQSNQFLPARRSPRRPRLGFRREAAWNLQRHQSVDRKSGGHVVRGTYYFLGYRTHSKAPRFRYPERF